MKLRLKPKVRITVTENQSGAKFYYFAFKETGATTFKWKKYTNKADVHSITDGLSSDLNDCDIFAYDGGNPPVPTNERVIAVYEFSIIHRLVEISESVTSTICTSIVPNSSNVNVLVIGENTALYDYFNALVIPTTGGGGLFPTG